MSKWALAFAAPILPPTTAGLIDMRGGSTWPGVTVEQAEQINCQSVNAFDGANYWGDNNEILLWYFDSTRKIYQLSMFPGYTGALAFHSRDGVHKYSLIPNQQVFKDNVAMSLDWGSARRSAPPPVRAAWAAELGDAITATFQPGLPPEPDCRANQHCILNNIGDNSYLFVPATGLGIWTDSYKAAQPTPSIFTPHRRRAREGSAVLDRRRDPEARRPGPHQRLERPRPVPQELHAALRHAVPG